MADKTNKLDKYSHLYFIEDLCNLLRCHRQTLRRLVKEGKLKPPMLLSDRKKVWLESDIVEFFANLPRDQDFATSDDDEDTDTPPAEE